MVSPSPKNMHPKVIMNNYLINDFTSLIFQKLSDFSFSDCYFSSIILFQTQKFGVFIALILSFLIQSENGCQNFKQNKKMKY